MPSDRLKLALERIQPGDWLLFEQFAAEFIAVDYPSLRTTASPAGDKGRDGQLYSPDEDPAVAVQYSVTTDWDGKIRRTLKRLKETFPSVRELVYASPQVIGPAADDLVKAVWRENQVRLDVRDRSWFVDRELSYPQREIASEELSRAKGDPLLVERRVKEYVAPVLTSEESRLALLHLALDARDHATNKGLTKTCFESLVLSVLHEAGPEARMSRAQITARVAKLLPAEFEGQVTQQADGAIQRLSARNGSSKAAGQDR